MAKQEQRTRRQVKSSRTKPRAGATATRGARATGPVKTRAGADAPVLLSGGNPQIAKADGDAPVQAYIAAMPGWKRAIGERLDALITRHVPGVRKAVKWNSPMYGVEGKGLFLGFHTFARFVKVTFFRGTLLRPVPPGGKARDARWIDVHEDDLDEAQMVKWVKQAAELPGWMLTSPAATTPTTTPNTAGTQGARTPRTPARAATSARKTHAVTGSASASHRIDQRIRDLGGWRGETLARMRALILEADPEMTEEWKWMVPVWSHNGIVCTGEAYAKVVKLTFARGASVPDPSRLFNSSLAGSTRRAIDIREREEVDAAAFKALVKAAVARNPG